MIKKMECMFYKFLWNNGPDKVKRNVMIQNYSEGGLRMIDIQNFIYHLKLTWLKRALKKNNNRWSTLSFKKMQTQEFLRYGAHYVRLTNVTQNQFWLDVFEAWEKLAESNTLETLSEEELLSEPLWYNAHFRNKKMCLQNWAKNGIVFLKDIVDEKGSIVSFQTLKERYHIQGTFLDYEQLKHNIPKDWLAKLAKSTDFIKVTPIPKHLRQIKSPSKQTAYFSLVRKKIIGKDNNSKRWDNLIPNGINWKNVYQSTIMATQSTYFRSFQYKIIRNFLCTNITLSKMKVTQDDTCSFCHIDRETVLHLFTECPVVQQFWKEVQKWYKKEMHEEIIFEQTNILFGFHPNDRLKNHIAVTAKSHIYQCRLRNLLPHLNIFLEQLRNIFNTERYIALVSNKYRSFVAKWSKLIDTFKSKNSKQ